MQYLTHTEYTVDSQHTSRRHSGGDDGGGSRWKLPTPYEISHIFHISRLSYVCPSHKPSPFHIVFVHKVSHISQKTFFRHEPVASLEIKNASSKALFFNAPWAKSLHSDSAGGERC